MSSEGVKVHQPLASFLQPDRAARLAEEGLFSDHLPGLRRAWPNVCAMWAVTVEEARRLPADKLDERVDGEWSFVETLRHLVFVSDAWVGDVVRERPEPHHRWGMPPHFIADAASSLGLDVDSRPSLDEVLAVRAERASDVAALLDELEDDDALHRVCAPRGGQFLVVGAIQTVLFEEWAHHSFATRDLARLAPPRA